jgi:hypothetical protein
MAFIDLPYGGLDTAAKKRQLSARAHPDALLKNVLFVQWSTNRKVYGVHKLRKAARRAGRDIDQQVVRLLRELSVRRESPVASGFSPADLILMPPTAQPPQVLKL